MRSSANTNRPISGYTLMELAVVAVVAGLAIAGGLSIQNANEKIKDQDITTERSANINTALNRFRDLYGYYPCPASNNVDRDSEYYGRPFAGCADVLTTPPDPGADGIYEDGVVIQKSERADQLDDPVNPNDNFNDLVLRGSVPFRTLGLSEKEAYDAYGSRFVYAVTASLTTEETFDPLNGGIGIINEDDVSLVSPASSVHFLAFSPGKNKIGGRNKAGNVTIACPGVSLDNDGVPLPTQNAERNNCRQDGDAVYRLASVKDTGDSNHFDDIVSYFGSADTKKWKASDEDTKDIHEKTDARIVIGADVLDDVSGTEKIEIVGGNILVTDNPETIDTVEQSVRSSSLCSSTSGDCFTSSLIGGELDGQPGGSGLECPEGEFMVGISGGVPLCEAEIFIGCDPNEIMRGIDSDGNPICEGNLVPPCPEKTIDMCDHPDDPDLTITIPQRKEGTVLNLYATECMIRDHIEDPLSGPFIGTHIQTVGDIDDRCPNNYARGNKVVTNHRGHYVKQVQYRCINSEWKYHRLIKPGGAYSGRCKCVEDFRTVPAAGSCPEGYEGDLQNIEKFECPQLKWVQYDTTGCGCVDGYERTVYDECPEGQEGSPTHLERLDCETGEFEYIDGSEGGDPCTCESRDPLETVTPCATGYKVDDPDGPAGSLTLQEWVCPNPDEPGLYEIVPGYPIDNCTCDSEHTDTFTLPCEAPFVGPGRKFIREFQCVDGVPTPEPQEDWEEITTAADCSPPIQRQCTWQASGDPIVLDGFIGGNQHEGNCNQFCDETSEICVKNIGQSSTQVWSDCICTD